MMLDQAAENAERAMARALARYTIWLCDSLHGEAIPAGSGAELLAQISTIQRESFVHAGRELAGLLRGHAAIATLLYEHRMACIRSSVPHKLASAEAVRLMEAQFEGLRALGRQCGDAGSDARIGGAGRNPAPNLPAQLH